MYTKSRSGWQKVWWPLVYTNSKCAREKVGRALVYTKSKSVWEIILVDSSVHKSKETWKMLVVIVVQSFKDQRKVSYKVGIGVQDIKETWWNSFVSLVAGIDCARILLQPLMNAWSAGCRDWADYGLLSQKKAVPKSIINQMDASGMLLHGCHMMFYSFKSTFLSSKSISWISEFENSSGLIFHMKNLLQFRTTFFT